MSAAFEALSTCPHLGALVARHGPPPLAESPDLFADLASAICCQQLSGKAAAAIEAKALAMLGGAWVPSALLAAGEDALRGAGLSRAKTRTLLELSGAVASGLDLEALRREPDEAVRAALTPIWGIGVWTVDMLLIFSMARPDVMPSLDYGIQKALQRLYQLEALPKPKETVALAERWRPYRSAACWYLWRLLDEPAPG